MSKEQTVLMRLADLCVEDIMEMSDEEILAEVVEDGEDPNFIARQMRELIDRAIAESSAKKEGQKRQDP